MIIILTNLIGILLIAGIVKWFWLFKQKPVDFKKNHLITIIVASNIYNPSFIKIKQGQPTTLRFIREDPSPCAQSVVFPELGISADLPLKKPFDILLPLDKSGNFEFTCAMGMYRGKLIIEP